MTTTPPGWYADPENPAQQRYWDGAAWTEHVAAAAPVVTMAPGWHPDPDVRGQIRYWDGSRWTDDVEQVPLFDGMVTLPSVARKKEQHLRVTTEEIVWGDDRIRWDDITWFSQLISIINGIAMYEIWVHRGDVQTRIVFGNGTRLNKNPRIAYETIIEQLRLTLGARIIAGLLDMVDKGETIRTGGLVFGPEGFGQDGKGELVPWRDFGGLEIGGYEGIYITMFRLEGDKKKKVLRLKIDQLRSWAVAPVVEAFARRYS